MVREKNKVGYINLKGEYAIQPEFTNGKSFSEGYAGATMGNLWGFIDNSGEWVIEPQFEKVKYFRSGHVLVLKNDNWIYIDRSGKILKTPYSDKYYDFQEGGVAFYRTGDLVGLIDTTGAIIIKPKFLKIQRFVNGRARVRGLHHEKFGMINTKGDTIINLEYDKLGDYHEKGVWAKKDGSDGIIRDGVFKPVEGAKHIWDFTDGSDYAPAKRRSKVGFINTKGEWVIEPAYSEAKAFNQGLAPVRIGQKWGLINELGKLVLPCRFDDINPYGDNGLAAFQLKEKWGFMNLKCAAAIPPKYQITPSLPIGFTEYIYSSGFAFGLARVKYKGKWGFLNKQGELLGDKWYQNAEPFVKID